VRPFLQPPPTRTCSSGSRRPSLTRKQVCFPFSCLSCYFFFFLLNFLLSVATPDALEEETAIFLGRYETGRTIGVGGYAEVKIGKDLKLDRKVAIKVIQKDMADAKGLERLEREINFLSCINHPNIVKLYDVVEADKTTVLVMQLLEGETLDDFVYEAPGQCLPPYVCKFLLPSSQK